MGRKLLKTVQTITTFRNRLADPVGTRRGPPLVCGPQFENRWFNWYAPRMSLGDKPLGRQTFGLQTPDHRTGNMDDVPVKVREWLPLGHCRTQFC